MGRVIAESLARKLRLHTCKGYSTRTYIIPRSTLAPVTPLKASAFAATEIFIPPREILLFLPQPA